MHRGDLQAAILSEVKRTCGERLQIVNGSKVTEIDAERGIVTLEDGRILQGDVILGADGVKTVCRSMMVPDKDNVGSG